MSNRQIKEIRTDIGNSSVDYTGSNVSNQNVETDTMSLEVDNNSAIESEIIDINKNSAFTSCLRNSIARNMNDAENGVYLKVNEKYWLDRDFVFDEMKNGTYLISVIDSNGTKVPMGYTSGDAYNKYVNHFSMENGDNGTYYVQTDVSGYNLKVYENGMICAYDADGILIKKINGNVVTSSTVGSGSQTKIYDDGSVVTVDSNGKIISISVNGENNVNLSSELENSSNKTVSEERESVVSNATSEPTVSSNDSRDNPYHNIDGNEVTDMITKECLKAGYDEEKTLIAVAIAKHETGNYTSNAFNNKYNLGGMMKKSGGLRSFDSLEEGVSEYVAYLDRMYFSDGLTTLETMQPRYCPIGASNDPNGLNANWLPGTKKNYEELRNSLHRES